LEDDFVQLVVDPEKVSQAYVESTIYGLVDLFGLVSFSLWCGVVLSAYFGLFMEAVEWTLLLVFACFSCDAVGECFFAVVTDAVTEESR